MKPTKAMSTAWKLWTSHFGDCIDYSAIVACVMLMPVAPLLFLLKKPLMPAALMAVPLFILLVLPMRMNAGEVLCEAVRGADSVSSSGLIFGGHYGQRLAKGLKMMLLLLLWSIPGIALTVYAYHMYKGAADAITIVTFILNLGGRDVKRGILYIVLIYAASWLPLLVGMMLHSGARFCQKGARTLKGHRGGMCLTWLCSLITLVPFFAAEAVILKNGISPIIVRVTSMQLDGISEMFLPMVWQSIVAVLVLLLPVVPLRHLTLAAYVTGLEEVKA